MALFFVFGIICLIEFNKLIQLKSKIPYVIFVILFMVFGYWQLQINSTIGLDEATQILMVITIFVELFLIKDLFSEKSIPLFITKRFILTTFYISSAFVFLILIANYHKSYNPDILLGSFILIWVNDSFAYLVGKTLGRTKLYPAVSPKKTVEGTLGGLVFTLGAAYIMAKYEDIVNPVQWVILAGVIVLTGSLGDLVESKLKRQAGVKDSGRIMPGHGGFFDRFDSLLLAGPSVWLLLTLFTQ